jgi:4-alpha-glucanotransferase
MFSADPERFSPYAPSNRLFLNVLHVDVPRLCGLAGMPVEDQAAPAPTETLIDWPALARARLRLARRAFDAMVGRGLLSAHTEIGGRFSDYCTRRGAALERHARFEALHAHMLQRDPALRHWRDWPEGLRDPDSVDVAAFAQTHGTDVAFHLFLQWRAECDLAAAQAAARRAGMAIGLIADLAVGTDDGGSYAWGHQPDLLSGVSIGAPPDAFNGLGQDWGLTSYSPRALRRSGFAPFIDLLRAVLRHGGGVRIDHILGLQRLWLVPHGASPRDGAYLTYPLRDLLRLVALEAWRHRAIVIGEDLGTVPAGLRAALRGKGILGTRVLWFERQHQTFTPARRWPKQVLACSSTHDLPTVVGWWQGRDIEWRVRLGLLAAGETEGSWLAAREVDRCALWQELRVAGVVRGDPPPPERGQQVLEGVIAFLAATPCSLVTLPLEDAVGAGEQPNLPGTTTQHPNWRQRLDRPIGDLLADPAIQRRLAALVTVR